MQLEGVAVRSGRNDGGTIGMRIEGGQTPRTGQTAQRHNLQALGAYFWRIFLRLGEEDPRSTSMFSRGDGCLPMARSKGRREDAEGRSSSERVAGATRIAALVGTRHACPPTSLQLAILCICEARGCGSNVRQEIRLHLGSGYSSILFVGWAVARDVEDGLT